MRDSEDEDGDLLINDTEMRPNEEEKSSQSPVLAGSSSGSSLKSSTLNYPGCVLSWFDNKSSSPGTNGGSKANKKFHGMSFKE